MPIHLNKKAFPKMMTVIVISFVLALFLTVLPLPAWAVWFRPEWVLLLCLYWQYHAQEYVGLGAAFIIGLCLDCLYGSALGVHSLAFLIVSAGLHGLRNTVRLQGLLVQMFLIFLLCVAYQCVLLVINLLLKQQVPFFWAYWAPPLMSALLWPWIHLLIDIKSDHR